MGATSNELTLQYYTYLGPRLCAIEGLGAHLRDPLSLETRNGRVRGTPGSRDLRTTAGLDPVQG